MGVIRILRLGEIESHLKEITSLSLQIKLFQEEYEDVLEQERDSRKELRSGDMSKDVFDRTQRLLRIEKKRIEMKINSIAKRISLVSKRLSALVKTSQI